MAKQALTIGMKIMGAFLIFGATMAALAGLTLVWQGTSLDAIWKLNPVAHQELAPAGKIFGTGMLLVALTLGVASVGWFLRRKWGWRLAVAIIGVQVMSDAIQLVSGRVLQGASGAVAGGLIFFYLIRQEVRSVFQK